MYLFVYLFGSIGSAYGHIYISPFARDHGMTTTEVSILVSVTNMCDFIGRGLCGVIANQRIVKNSTIVAISQLVTGTTLALCSFYGSFWSFIVLAVMFGLFAGAIFSMTPSMVVDFVGIENFRTAFGILILGQGITMGTGAPLLGYLRDVSLSYMPSFYFMGTCLILSGLVLLMEPCVRKRQDKMETVAPLQKKWRFLHDTYVLHLRKSKLSPDGRRSASCCCVVIGRLISHRCPCSLVEFLSSRERTQ